MKLRAPKRIILPSVRPNVGVEAAYRRQLLQLVDLMAKDVTRQVLAAYKATPPHAMASDASPARGLHDLMGRLGRHWNKRFTHEANKIAKDFADGSMKASDFAFTP